MWGVLAISVWVFIVCIVFYMIGYNDAKDIYKRDPNPSIHDEGYNKGYNKGYIGAKMDPYEDGERTILSKGP